MHIEWLKKRPNRVLIITHRNGDVDGVTSSIAVKRLILSMNKRAKIDLVSPEGLSSQAKRVVERLKENFSQAIPSDDYQLVVITDTGHSSLLEEQLKIINQARAPKLLIDHHPLDKSMQMLVDYAFVDEEASSACEMVYRIFKELRVKPDKKALVSIALGIMSDSQFLTIARGPAIMVMAELIKEGIDPEEIRSMLRHRKDVSEQIARIKGVLRSSFYRSQSWIIGTTIIGSYHASVARALIELGCDLAFAAGEGDNDKETKGSIRSNQLFYSSTKIHVGKDICKRLAEMSEGSGGGHPTAGAFTVNERAEKVKENFLKIVEDGLGERLKRIV